MASYEEQGSMLGTALTLSPWVGASIYHGKEAKMAQRVNRVYGGRLGGTAKRFLPEGSKRLATRMSTGRMKGALNIAKKQGVFRASAWGAAKRAGVTAPLAKIAASRAASMFFTGFNIYMFAPLAYSGVKGAVNALRDIGAETRRLDFGGDYVDTRGAYTERQRSIRAITSSRHSTRAAIGNEALLMHR